MSEFAFGLVISISRNGIFFVVCSLGWVVGGWGGPLICEADFASGGLPTMGDGRLRVYTALY